MMEDLVINTESEGRVETRTLGELSEFLHNMLELSNSLNDFLNKVDYGLTDETSRLDQATHITLTNWYLNTIGHEVE
jgi:hypothetical protein